jgi:dGTPase
MNNFAKFATFDNYSKARLYKEEINLFGNNCPANFDLTSNFFDEDNSAFLLDYQRIIASTSFRRLQYKTQVFVNYQNDHHRTRLTHSLEVASIAAIIARKLKVNLALAQNIALAHDLGHAAFGHAGEDALNYKMKNFGGFSHNSFALELVTKIEKISTKFNGLNLSFELLQGLVKHNGPIFSKKIGEGYIFEYNQIHNLNLEKFASIEAQIAAISDDIAYNNHDLEDGLRSNLLKIEIIKSLPLIGKIYQEILSQYPNIKQEILVQEAKRIITATMIEDIILQTQKNIAKYNVNSLQDVYNCKVQLVNFSSEFEQIFAAIKEFLFKNLYRHSLINQMTHNANNIINFLFDYYCNYPEKLPQQIWQENFNVDLAANFLQLSQKEIAKTVCNYIAGMTDRFAIKQYQAIAKKNLTK